MEQKSNLNRIAHLFAEHLKDAIESEQIPDVGILIFYWDGDSLDCKIISHIGEFEEGDINA